MHPANAWYALECMKTTLSFPLIVVWCLCLCPLRAGDPVVSNARAAQRPGTQLVDIIYDVADPDSATLTVSVAVSDTGGATYAVPASSFSGDVGSAVTPGGNKRIVWDAAPAPAGMVLIPAGSFQMGDSFGEGDSSERPVHSVTVSAFCMDKYEVTKALWDEVYQWAVSRPAELRYSFDNAGSGKVANHPVHTVNWYDMVKWCNARSEKEGRVAAYYTSAAQTTVYRTGRVDVQNDWVRWNAGYRLPTESEWEYAARGGLSGKRFPWGDTISHSQANYYSYWQSGKPYYNYDVNPNEGYHPDCDTGDYPYSSPVGSFGANGYGLYDMAGNVWEWCWDWSGGYGSGVQANPRGLAGGWIRVIRGGNWDIHAWSCRVALRYGSWPARGYDFGFRSVLPPGL